MSQLELTGALKDEADFANADYAKHANNLEIDPEMWEAYSNPHELWDWRQMSVMQLGDLEGKELLDYGCGMGEESIYFAKLGANVTSIDIAEVGIEVLRRRAKHHGLTNVKAIQMRADKTEFADNTFDLVHGLGILHHIGLDAALAEVHRVLKPGGIGVFLEPMGDNPVVEKAKEWLLEHAMKVTEHQDGLTHVTEHEENLKWAGIAESTRRFSSTRTYPYRLLYRVRRVLPESTYKLLHRIDHALFNLAPRLKTFAGAVVIRVRK